MSLLKNLSSFFGNIMQRTTIDGATARDLISQGAQLIDVRTPAEFNDRHIDGAVNIPLDTLSGAITSGKLDAPTVVYCRSGARSAQARSMIIKAGNEQVSDLGGIGNW